MNYKNDYKDKFTVESEQSHAWLEPPSEKSSTKAANHPPATRAAPNHDYNGYAGAPAGDAAPSAAPAAKTSSGQHGAAAVGGSGPSSGLKKHQGKSVAEDKRKRSVWLGVDIFLLLSLHSIISPPRLASFLLLTWMIFPTTV